MMCTLLLTLLSSIAQAEPPADVIQEIPNGSINWTQMLLVVSSRSDRTVGAWKDRRVQEQDALDSLPPRIQAAARKVPVTPDNAAEDIISDGGEAGIAVEEGLGNWRVIETRYHASGGVEMDGGIDIGLLLRPALAALAAAEAPAAAPPGGPTGIVIDARDLPFVPCIAPSVMTADGRTFSRAQSLHVDAARLLTPVVFVSDPAAVTAWKRAGDAPIFARASAARACEVVLDPASPLVQDPAAPALVAAGKVVIVVGAR